MTLAGAIATARDMGSRFGHAFRVYRLPAWPADVYGVMRDDRELPHEAVIVETWHADGRCARAHHDEREPAGEAVQRPPIQPVPTPIAADDPQGSLF